MKGVGGPICADPEMIPEAAAIPVILPNRSDIDGCPEAGIIRGHPNSQTGVVHGRSIGVMEIKRRGEGAVVFLDFQLIAGRRCSDAKAGICVIPEQISRCPEASRVIELHLSAASGGRGGRAAVDICPCSSVAKLMDVRGVVIADRAFGAGIACGCGIANADAALPPSIT